ncbi:MAG TPA: SusC/RagA family TonB-linked outer membrane protein, partial [Chitinophagaceae bacterium]|nr:SusC/RagA family TonB-linked outer membrane protein [Chitinophagaceae bacterium]
MKRKTALARGGILLILCLSITTIAFSQNTFKVTGKVTDETGKPVEGATVQVKGTTIATSTIADGTYSLMAPSGTGTLVITSVGYTQQEVAINNKPEVNVKTASIASSLQDVVVIGYTTVKRKDVTGAVGGINQKDIKSRPVDNALQAMQGKVAGVDIGSNERPGTVPTINIRGVRSLTASNTPLFVVDGIPLITGSIDNINPQDIESIDVLKDASATAIYGSRGANGVVIITTKQAKAGKVTVSLNSSFTLDELVDNTEMFNAGDFITFRRWAYYYAGLNPTTGISTYPRGDQPDINRDKVYFSATADPYAWANIAQGWASGTWDPSKVKTTDWMGMVTQQSMTTDNILSVSGGTDKIKAYASFGYLNNKGTIKGQSFERYTARANVDIAATKWLSFGTNLNLSYGTQQYGQSGTGVSTVGNPQGGLYESARGVFPFAVPFDSAGNRISFPGADNAVKTVVDEWKYNI